MTSQRESSVLGPTVEALERLGFRVLRLNAGLASRGGRRIRLAKAGTPDLLVLLSRGRCLWIETKRPVGGRVGAAQVVYHAALRRLGHRVELVTSAADAVRLVVAANGSP